MKRTASLYAKALYQALKKGENLKKVAQNFYQILRKNRDQKLLNPIWERLTKEISRQENILPVYLEIAQDLPQKQEKKLGRNLSQKFGKKIEFIKIINPHVLGGMKIIVDDLMIDATVSYKLRSLGENLWPK